MEMLKWKDCRVVLNKQEVQSQIITLIEKGETCYYAAELLSWVPAKNWHADLTKQLVNSMMFLIRKTSGLVVSHQPLLFVALSIEFLRAVAFASLEHKSKCLAAAKLMEKCGKILQAKIPDEDELKYFMTQTDTHGRTVFTIVSKNRYYSLLEEDDIGTIVSKMWIGSKAHHDVLEASTIYKSVEAPAGSEEALLFMKRIDKSKPYVFQYEQWAESCQLRFFA
jgi:hypothetical protein